MLRSFLLAAATLALVGPAHAHTGLDVGGFPAGFMHPFGGLDHLLAMVGVGLWAAQLGGRALWLVPLSFVGVMVLGGALGMAGFEPPGVEGGILGSVLLLGLLVAWAPRLPLAVPVAAVALFAIFHGLAHGAELPAGSSGLTYAIGFALATALLHGAGLAAGAMAAVRLGAWSQRAAGAAIAGLAVVLIAAA